MINRDISLKIIYYFLIVIVLFFVGLRFIHLNADFPWEISKAGALFTDEGWYSNSAVSHKLEGEWRQKGDFNNIVNLPVIHFLHSITFFFFGISLAGARITILFFYVLMTGSLFLLFYKKYNVWIAMLMALFISIDYHMFVFGRVAIIEIPMMAFIILAFLPIAYGEKIGNKEIILSAIIITVAMLTKTTAIFSLPMFLLYIYSEKNDPKIKIKNIALFIIVLSAIYLSYLGIVQTYYGDDYNFFTRINFKNRLVTSVDMLAFTTYASFVRTKMIFGNFYLITLILTAVLVYLSEAFRKNRMVYASLTWIFFSQFILIVTAYQPTRYFVPVGVGIYMLATLIIHELLKMTAYKKIIFALVIVGVILQLSEQSEKIIGYFKHEKFSYHDAALEMKRIITTEKGDTRNVVLMGPIADTVNLTIHANSRNPTLSPAGFEKGLLEFKPDYYVSCGVEDEELAIIKKYYDIVQIAQFDVMDNYYRKEGVLFYRIENRTNTENPIEMN